MSPLRHIAIVVPARNEEDLIGACVLSIRSSIAHLSRDHPRLSCDIIVVVDCCADQTGAQAVAHGARTLISTHGRVGSTRHLGAADAISRTRHAGVPDRAVWLANTDADTTVPENWLATQVRYADTGYDAVIGTVTPEGLDGPTDALWRQRHRLTEEHDHVHGANLGVRASTYMAVGGFAAVSLNEDLGLVNRVKAGTDRWATTHQTNVRTSARTRSRVEGGFASYIADLGSGANSCA